MAPLTAGTHMYATVSFQAFLRYADGTEEIYDLQEDPNEWTNLLNSPTAETALRKLRSHADAVSAQATAP